MKSNRAVSAAMPSRGMRRGLFPFLSFGIAILFLTVANAHATECLDYPWTCGNTYVVNTTADSSDGSTACTSGNPCSLRDAITVANHDSMAGDIIGFSVTGTITLTSALPAMTKDLYIDGPGAGALTVSGNHAFQVFAFVDADSRISGLTIADGSLSSPVYIDDSTVYDPGGGAIFNSQGFLTVLNSTFSGNSSGTGGAIYNSQGTLTVLNSTFSQNSSGNGGAIYNSEGQSQSTVANSTFSGNSATEGGAISNYATAPLTVTNSTFSGNSAPQGPGGAIYNTGQLTVTDNIFSGNSAAQGSGGAIDNDTSAKGATIESESNNLFYNNAGGDASGFTLSSTDVTGKDPMLLPLGNYGGPTETMMPQVASPAICAGNASDLETALEVSSLSFASDQRGFPASPAVGACTNANIDIGAVQTNYLIVTSTSDSPSTTGSLPYEVSAANGQSYADIGFSLGAAPATINLCPNGGCGSPALSLTQGNTVLVGPPGAVTISGDGATQILVVGSSATASLYGLILTKGYVADNDTGTDGGAIQNGGTLVVTDCAFPFNQTLGYDSSGGAIFNRATGTLTIIGSTFSTNNIAAGGAGGAIFAQGTLTVVNSTFTGNLATGGGAIFAQGTLTVTNSTFSGNQADYTDCVGGNGSAIYSSADKAMTLFDSIFYNNSTLGCGSYAVYATSPTEGNNLFYDNSGGDAGDFTLSGTDVTGSNPNLAFGIYGGPTQTMLPLPGSAAICAGTANLPGGLMLPGTDQRGFPRTTTYTVNSSLLTCVDIGAVQTNYQSIQFTNVPANGYTDVVGTVVNPPAPNVSVTENGQNIGGVPVTLALSNFTGASPYTTGGLGPVTTVADSGATFSGLTVSTTGTGTLSATLDLFTPNGGTPVSITTNPTATLTVETLEQAAIDYVNMLYTDEVLNSGQDNSLVKEMNKATELISEGKISGAINNLQDFISEVNDLYSSGVLNQTQANTLLAYANDAIKPLE